MPIKVTCESCGKTMNAKDESAGKRAKCPGCGEVIQIPEAVHEAEAADDDEDYGVSNDDEYDTSDDDDVKRKPCPACGEMIVRTAAKCRFCGEVFDKALAGSKRVKGRGKVDSETIRKFRREMHALGGLWIFFGVICLALAVFLLGSGGLPNRQIQGMEPGPFGAFLLILGIVWFAAGVLTCLKQMWAVWVGIVMSGLSVMGNIVQFNLCGLLLPLAALIQGWKCIGVAKEMREAGIPLNTKP